ncbi:MAG: 2-amino-4-hydroxy-6-hydroxymethyldihydropteridine diphosphokinase [Deltaproteobacteria bacterium]|nr:2-amino-4-hydroxy-6-hydroxymethyldihydropteridine diphosphokinase [Deltaproteobacteria bacterium]
MAQAVIALGSNLQPEANFSLAMDKLGQKVTFLAVSKVYRTPPWGYIPQPPFLNGVVVVETRQTPLELLKTLQHVESDLGRERTIPNGPRTIDLDLLLFEGLILHEPNLSIPHPEMENRAFVLVPLCDVIPHLCHPILGVPMTHLLHRLDTSEVKPVQFSLGKWLHNPQKGTGQGGINPCS